MLFVWGKILIRFQCIVHDYTACMDYIDQDACCPQQAGKLNHLLTHLNLLVNVSNYEIWLLVRLSLLRILEKMTHDIWSKTAASPLLMHGDPTVLWKAIDMISLICKCLVDHVTAYCSNCVHWLDYWSTLSSPIDQYWQCDWTPSHWYQPSCFLGRVLIIYMWLSLNCLHPEWFKRKTN